MSASAELQKLLVATLRADAAVAAIVGARVYDAAPADAVFPFISLGPSDFTEEDADDITARVETVQIDVWHRDQNRKWPCKETVDAVYAALHKADMALPNPYGVAQVFVRLARVMSDPDGITAHGVLSVEATVETI